MQFFFWGGGNKTSKVLKSKVFPSNTARKNIFPRFPAGLLGMQCYE